MSGWIVGQWVAASRREWTVAVVSSAFFQPQAQKLKPRGNWIRTHPSSPQHPTPHPPHPTTTLSGERGRAQWLMRALLLCWILHSQTRFWLGGQFVSSDLLVSRASCPSWMVPQRRGAEKKEEKKIGRKKNLLSRNRVSLRGGLPLVDGCLAAAWTTYDHLQRQLSYKYTSDWPPFVSPAER